MEYNWHSLYPGQARFLCEDLDDFWNSVALYKQPCFSQDGDYFLDSVGSPVSLKYDDYFWDSVGGPVFPKMEITFGTIQMTLFL